MYSSGDISRAMKTTKGLIALATGNLGELDRIIRDDRDRRKRDEFNRLLFVDRKFNARTMPQWVRNDPSNRLSVAWVRDNLTGHEMYKEMALLLNFSQKRIGRP